MELKVYFLLTLKQKKQMEKKQKVGQLIVNIVVAVLSALATFFGLTI